MGNIFLSEFAESELKSFNPSDQQQVARVIHLLEDDDFRKYNKTDLVLIESGYDVWSLCIGKIWLAFVEEDDDSVKIVHISLLSRFRTPNMDLA